MSYSPKNEHSPSIMTVGSWKTTFLLKSHLLGDMLVFGGVDEMLQDFVSSQSTTEDQPFLAKPYAILIVVFWSRSNRLSTQSMRNE